MFKPAVSFIKIFNSKLQIDMVVTLSEIYLFNVDIENFIRYLEDMTVMSFLMHSIRMINELGKNLSSNA